MLVLEIRDYWVVKYSSRLVFLYGNGNNLVDWCLYMVMLLDYVLCFEM